MKAQKSLRNGINFIFLSVWLIIFIMQMIYIYTLYRKALSDTQTSFENSMVSIHGVLEQKIHIATHIGKSISSDTNAMEYFLCDDTRNCQALWQSLITPLQEAYAITSEQFYALSFRGEQTPENISGGTGPQLIQAAYKAYTAFKTNNERLAFISVEDTPFADMFFFLFYDIKTPDTDSVDIKRLGTFVIAGKINKAEYIRQLGIDEKSKLVLRYGEDEATDVVLMSGLSNDSTRFSWKQGVENTNWFLCGSTAADTPIPAGLVLLVAETVFMSILFLVMQQYIRINIFAPLYKISDFLKRYTLTQKNKRIHLQNHTEIGGVADKIDKMIDGIEYLSRRIMQTQQKLYESEIAQKDASLYALQAQLNPHFMYNTLDCICGIAHVSDVPQIADVTVALAKMLRYSLSEERTVPLRREIEIIKNYLTIMEVRRPNYFTAEFHISAEAENALCPKMLLQPIVENTFKHGFNTHAENARIVVTAKLETDCFIISIFDNGRGIPKEKLSSILSEFAAMNHSFYTTSGDSPHIGLINIQNRILLNYGENFGLHLESEEGKFTEVVLRLPKMFSQDSTDI